MTFAVSGEQEELGRSVRRFLAARAPMSEVRRAVEGPAGHDPQVWDLMCDQLGLPAIALPERYGGLGYGAVELGIVLEELGRALSPEPLLASVALAGRALARSGSTELCDAWLPGIAAGSATAALALVETDRAWDARPLATAAPVPGGHRLTGVKTLVIDGDTADLVLVAATGEEGPALYAVEPDATVTRTPVTALDPTRRLADLVLDSTPARRVDLPPGGLREVLDAALVAVAAEQVGGTQACLDMTVAHVGDRVQFDRPVGSFQAVKHRCADLLVALEAARSALWHATAVLAAREGAPGAARPGPDGSGPDRPGADDLGAAAAVCAAWCGQAFVDAAKATVQLHGGIGYTWEHDAHLYLRRAKTMQLLFGGSSRHRARLADLVGIGGGGG